MRKILFLALIVCLSLPVFAQQTVSEGATPVKTADASLPADAPTRAQVMTLLEAMQARKTMATVMENMKQIMGEAAEREFRKRVPNPTAKQLEALHGVYDDIVTASLDDMINAIIPVYQRHLSKTDVDDMIRFYSSPVGQKLLREQPQIMQESMRAGVEVQQKRMDEMMVKVKQHAQDLADTTQDSTVTPKK
jgi:hypothetical protein